MNRFIIQSEVFDDDLSEIQSAITNCGWQYTVLDKVTDEVAYSVSNESDTICVLGSVNFCLEAGRTRSDWQPGPILTIENYNCSRYYAHFGPYLLNHDYQILPYGELARKTRGEKFIRPDRGNKIFTGEVFSQEQIRSQYGCLNFANVRPDELIVAAGPKVIFFEYRMIIVKDQVISGSKYVDNGMITISPDVPHEVYEYCQKILDETSWRPDPAFVMDVAMTSQGPRLIEINAFSSSGLYQCDYNKVMESIIDLLEDEEYYI